ncbi:MAG: hypothetical protein M1378_09870 [Bacteroidetes bacterium]|nr:hypothetical protein [Bacteroidota bacterium]MCL5034437.1 hypothetical protein [Bacteroidota bacterium]
MLQQTTVSKGAKRFGWLDGVFHDTSEKKEIACDIAFLCDDYAAAVRIAANLSSHSRWIPYPFLSTRLKKIAEEMRAQAEALRIKIAELDGQLPQVSMENRDLMEFRQNVKRLVGDMEEHASRTEIMMHQRNQIKDPDVIRLIDALVLDMQRQKEELLDIVMRLS